ncbi:ras-related GTP-binding protein, putative [Trypanosoma cruzi]|nr:ras-related GTP-binding protein, putative [Trypanosoma cruzi]
MALHHLSDMTFEELEHFVRTNGESMQLSPADVVALHLHRQRRGYLSGRELPLWPHDSIKRGDERPSCHALRLLILGEETDAKLGLAALLLHGGGRPRHETLLLGLGPVEEEETEPGGGDGNSRGDAALPRIEVLVPAVADVTASLRGELCIASDVVLLCFDVNERATFDALRQRWWKDEVGRAFAVLAQDLAEAHHATPWPATPVIVVGLAAEKREALAGKNTIPVSHTEAVQLAQKMGASKYMEIFSDNLHHARSLVTQCMQVTNAFQQSLLKEVGAEALSFLTAAKQQMLRYHLRAPKPDGEIDSQAMQLRLQMTPGITYFMTFDGTDPRHHVSPAQFPHEGIVDLRPYSKQSGTVLRICGMARCAYSSIVLEIEVPSTLKPPSGYFDIAWRRFVLTKTPDDALFASREVRYTLDGTQPTRASMLYTHPIELDVKSSANFPWGSWRSSVTPPRVIRLAAFAEGEFTSPTVTYEVPAVLKTPQIEYSPQESTVFLNSMQPMVEYRYTLDGTMPTLTSPLYTGPFSLAADVTQQVRVVAFPRVSFPSREAVFYVPKVKTSSSGSGICGGNSNGTTAAATSRINNAFHITRTTIMRGQHSAQKLRGSSLNSLIGSTSGRRRKRMSNVNSSNEEENGQSQALVRSSTSFSSSYASSPKLRTAARAALNRCHNSSSSSSGIATTTSKTCNLKEIPRKRRVCSSSLSPLAPQNPRIRSKSHTYDGDGDDDENFLQVSMATTTMGNYEFVKGKKRGDDKNCGRRGLKDDMKSKCGAPQCTADDNIVVFDFPEPISLSYISVMTPGEGAGPKSYEVEVKHAYGTDFLSVGSGELKDIKGVQKLEVIENACLFPIDKVRCVFDGTASGFCVKDLKVHGKPFN